MRRHPLIIAALAAFLLFGWTVAQAQDSTYQPWQGQAQGGDLQQLLKQLRQLIAKAEHDKAADPVFLSDLRKLADSYDNPWPAKLLYDDFRDGDYTDSPVWTPTAGNWSVSLQGSYQGLRSQVPVAGAATTQGGSNTTNAVIGILGAILSQQGGQTQQQQNQYAAISTALAISNAFVIRLQIASRAPAGRFYFGPYGGTNAENGYYLNYQPAAANGLTLLSVTPSGGTVQLASSNGPVHIEDGKLHTIEWKRDRGGRMTIALDGNAMIQANDNSMRGAFNGFLLANGGGSYAVKSVEIDGRSQY